MGRLSGEVSSPEVIPVKMVACMGVSRPGCTAASQGGNSRLRPSTTYTRAWPNKATRSEVTIPVNPQNHLQPHMKDCTCQLIKSLGH